MTYTRLHPWSLVVAKLLCDAGVCTGPGSGAGRWPVYADDEPQSPDDCVTVYVTEGTDDGTDMTTGESMSHNGIQVRVRGASPEAAWKKADEVWTLLTRGVYLRVVQFPATADVPFAEYLIQCFARVTDPIPLTRAADSRRVVITFNATIAGDPL